MQNLLSSKNLKIDKSIHSAYVKAIRSAQHFVYIENQYFVGSSYSWPTYKNAGIDLPQTLLSLYEHLVSWNTAIVILIFLCRC